MKGLRRRPLSHVIDVVIVVLVVTVIKQLADRHSPKSQATFNARPALVRGEAIPAVPVRDLTRGGSVATALNQIEKGRCHVLNLFDSECPACIRTARAWRGVKEVNEHDYRLPVVWLAMSPADSGALNYNSKYDLRGGLYGVYSVADALELRQYMVPASVVVDARQRIIGYRGPEPKDVLTGDAIAEYLKDVCPKEQATGRPTAIASGRG